LSEKLTAFYYISSKCSTRLAGKKTKPASKQNLKAGLYTLERVTGIESTQPAWNIRRRQEASGSLSGLGSPYGDPNLEEISRRYAQQARMSPCSAPRFLPSINYRGVIFNRLANCTWVKP
jgi:hypothetical protein